MAPPLSLATTMLTKLEQKLKPVIATLVFFFALLISGFLKGAMDQEGVPLSMRGFVDVAFTFLQICMFLTWLSFICQWKNILFLAAPSTLAILAMIVLYEGVWREEGLEAERQTKEHAVHEDLAKNSVNSWPCRSGWKLNEKEENGVTSYFLAEKRTSVAPILIAKVKADHTIEPLGSASALPIDQLKDILKSCTGEGFEALRHAYFPIAPAQPPKVRN
ncbi:MAG: hypothetical protein AB7E85_08205 [Pseudobdellovibrionaceae bacterium]